MRAQASGLMHQLLQLRTVQIDFHWDEIGTLQKRH
jgi:hypothetical protein